jgi:hypothetical protein
MGLFSHCNIRKASRTACFFASGKEDNKAGQHTARLYCDIKSDY